MFEGLKSALGLTISDAKPQASGVDAVTHRMLRDLNLPDPDAAAAPIANRRDPLEQAREQVEDWLAEGKDIEQELDIVFEALFDTQAQAQAYLAAARSAGFDDSAAQATRAFAASIAATILVSMIPAPEDLARIEGMLAPLAQQNGGVFDGYYLDGQQQA
ncbi:MAG: ribonuclease E inhibitor RraB [Hyphomicrobiales bacterium]|nr:ribonuclease E inhibitor RraB [Hyphomicrobiales bacterium]